ncbi:MAG: hypothetical protein HPY74_07610 [Firmicutes bacterium]|nr:hypothetical protein [Bacillota bacterium]
MEGAERIVNKILEDARLQAQNNIEQAEKQAADIINSAKNEAEKKKNIIIENAKKEAEERKKRLIAVAELEARKIKLKAKQEIIASVFEQAIKTLNSLPPERYMEIITDMVLNSVKKGDEEIILSERDKSRLGDGFIGIINKKLKEKNINGNVKLSEETANINGGFILRSGNIEMNNSFEAIMRMRYNEIESEIVKMLFE